MPTFFFWNAAKKPQAEHLRIVADNHDVDLFLLAEYTESSADVLDSLNKNRNGSIYWEDTRGKSSLRVFTRLPIQCIVPRFDDGRVTIKEISPPLGASILFVGAHLRSKLHATDQTQHLSARRLRAYIESEEIRAGHQRTLVLGDLNMNPFDLGMISSDGLHAVMDKKIAMKRERTVLGESYGYFYNPMWSRMGDESKGPPGSFYYRSGQADELGWNLFDHLLVRPDLLRYYEHENVNVLTSIGGVSLLRNDKINTAVSDHLPLLAKLTTERAV